MTWAALHEAMERDGVQITDHAHFARLASRLPDEERQLAYADYRVAWGEAVTGGKLEDTQPGKGKAWR